MEFNTIFQITVISFMLNFQGRVLQAHFNGEQLVIRASHLYDFSTPEKATIPMRWFLLQMASEMIGDTKWL
jgi:hypothetical protein